MSLTIHHVKIHRNDMNKNDRKTTTKSFCSTRERKTAW
eukprot:UN17335